MVPPGRNVYMTGASYVAANSLATSSKVYKRLSELNLSPEMGFVTLFEYTPLTTINSIAPDATAFASRGPQSNVMIASFWDNLTEESLESARSGTSSLKKIVTEEQKFSYTNSENEGYSNYETIEKAPPSRTKLVYKDNYTRLQKSKAKYDPNGVFSRWFGIEPAEAS